MWIAVLFWLSIPISLIASVIGIWKNKFWLILIGAILFFPIAYYFNGSPTLRGYAIFLPLFQVGSAAALKERNKLWAWLLLLPAFLTVIWLIIFVVIYQTS